jgi:hypothetical protein
MDAQTPPVDYARKRGNFILAFYRRLRRRLAAHRIINRRLQALEDGARAEPAGLADARRMLGDITRQLNEAQHQIAEMNRQLDQIGGGDAMQRSLDEAHRQLRVRAVMDWIASITVASGPLITVILPTRDRRALLERAIASMQAQSYPNWELVVIDDGSTDATAEFLNSNTHPKLRHARTAGGGVCVARNAGLKIARGELIAYLDDDNTMHPNWLKSVVWAFGEHPETDTLYGAFEVDDTRRIDRVGRGDLPRLCFFPYDHNDVVQNNIADIGCIAHRAGLEEARFDETLREMGDWDLFLRLTRDHPPLALPAVACFYTTDAPHRLSHGPTFQADIDKVRSKNQR